MYPYLIENCHLHYIDDFGILITKYGNYILNDIETYMITMFDGKKSLNEIVDRISIELETNCKDRIKEILIEFINSKATVIKISEKENPVDISITGKKGIKMPMSIILNLTNKCNLKCIHCFKSCDGFNNKELPLERVMSMLNSLKGNLMEIQLTGGEPMLHKNFTTILKYCIKNFQTTITTTGTLINSKNIEDFKGISAIQFSLYSYDSKKHDSVTLTPGSYEKTINAIKEAINANINVSIATIITKENYNDIEKIIKLAISFGVNRIRFGILIPLGRGIKVNNVWNLSNDEIKIIIENLDYYSNEYKDKIIVESWQEEVESKSIDKKYNCLGCGAGILSWTICESGIVKPCEYLPDDLYQIGNIVENSVEDIISKCNFKGLPYCINRWSKELKKQNIEISSVCPQMESYLVEHDNCL